MPTQYRSFFIDSSIKDCDLWHPGDYKGLPGLCYLSCYIVVDGWLPSVWPYLPSPIHLTSSLSSSISVLCPLPPVPLHLSRPLYSSIHFPPTFFFSFNILYSHHVGVAVNSRVSSKIQQLLNTLKRPKRPPLREFFVDDFEELLDGKLTWK